MGKKIILNEAQFKDYMRVIKESVGETDNENYLEFDDIIKLLHAVIDNDFLCYFSNGKVYNCNAIHTKGDILEAICDGYPRLKENGRIALRNDSYGNFEIDNLLA